MYADDFEYDGKHLSDFGFMVCTLGDGGGTETNEKGSEITFHLTPSRGGRRFYSMGSEYETCLSTSFQICKNPEFYRDDEMVITSEEFRSLARWLNRREFLWFHSFDWCEPEKQLPWVRATFTLSKIDFGRETIGIELNMITDSPFGYGEEIEEICLAIAGHRGEADGAGSKLAQILKKADKLSRPCYACDARDTCKWPDEKKNLSVVI